MGDITNAIEEWKPPLDLVLELSREILEIDEICQLQKCVPCGAEQSINIVLNSTMPGS